MVGKPIHRKIPEGVIVDPMGTRLTFTAFEEHGELPKWLLGLLKFSCEWTNDMYIYIYITYILI